MDTPCVIWEGHVDRDGYGRRNLSGATTRMVHRQVYIANFGPIPPGMTVDHLCFTKLCIAPAHLRLLTRLDNQRNQRSAYKTRCVNGHEYTPENTYIRPSRGGGVRDCRTCIRDRVARYKLSRRAA